MKTQLTRLVLAFSTIALMTTAVGPVASATTLIPDCNLPEVVCEHHPCRPLSGTCRWVEHVYADCIDGPIVAFPDTVGALSAFADRVLGCDLS